MKKLLQVFTSSVFLFSAQNVAAEIPALSIRPEGVIQGEPIMIIVNGVSGIDTVQKILFDGKSLWFFVWNGKPAALLGLDLNVKSGVHEVTVKMENGEIFKKVFSVGERTKIETPLGIPEKLGGNTPTSQKNLIVSLSKENALINNIFSARKRYWAENFRFPLNTAEKITDDYGYIRKTGYYSIPHKGSDFRAAEGTPVYAINRGIVRLAKQLKIYGNTVAIDHGLGLITYYMHLSKINVKEGNLVGKGKLIGLSGQTGYAESPHLHLSVKIGGVSIDPVRFFDLFKI